MANGDSSIQIDPRLLQIPVTGQLIGSTQSAPISFQDLRQLLPQNQQQQPQQPQSNAATGFDAKTQSSLDSLQPDFADRAKQWIQGMRNAGYNPVLHFGYRSPQEQQSLYEKYLAGGHKAVAPPMSYHTYGRAFDWVNQGSKGELQWDNDKAYEFGQKLATNYGLTGIGASDNDHIQDANYKSWKDLPKGDYGNIKPRQPAQTAQNQPAAQPAQQQPGQQVPPNLTAIALQGGPQWQDLSQYMPKQ